MSEPPQLVETDPDEIAPLSDDPLPAMNPADAIEQRLAVPVDDEDYR